MSTAVPSYLTGYADSFARDPRTAALSWFSDARFGLFIHYGLYSLLGEGEWVMYHKQIPPDEYAKLRERFRPDKFDADFITDLALEAEMRYVNLVTCHHDSFCLWNSKAEPFNITTAAPGRDLVGELAEACAKKKLGLFFYYTYGVNWRHPYFFSRDYSPMARPDYPAPDTYYKFRKREDFRHFISYSHAVMKELLSGFGPVAGMWLDLIMNYYAQPEMFPIEETYAFIRSLQPQTLVSFKQGATGAEDFATPERSFQSLGPRVAERFDERRAIIADTAWARNKSKHNEICDTLQNHAWAFNRNDDGRHKDADEVLRMLANASYRNCNLLLNTGPLPDGSIHPEDVKTLREVGRRIRRDGWPEPRPFEATPKPTVTDPNAPSAG